MTSFKNRKDELKKLQKMLTSNKFEFGITYGRRRVGKTALHLKASSQHKVIYYLARKSNNATKFKEQCVKVIPKAKIIAEDFEFLFEFLKDKVDCIIIDEFPNLIEEDSNLLNIFQVIVDTIVKNTPMSLFILGSSISLMKSKILSTSSPLYGRKSLSLKLSALPFYHLFEFYPNANIEEIIEIYGLADGIPYYLNQIDDSFWKWLDGELKVPTFIRDEGEFLVRYEFINSGRYFSILEAIARGKTRMNAIAQYTKIAITSLSSYLHNLQEVEFIKKEISITEKLPSKRGIYVLTDNFLRFWFHFIYPNLESLDQALLSAKEIRATYPNYMGSIFEKVVKQFLIKFQQFLQIEPFSKIGRWWWKEEEIDLIAYNPLNDQATLVECKWKTKVSAHAIATSLIKKEEKISYSGEFKTKRHTIMLFAKSFSKKITKLGDHRVVCIDLGDMKEIISKNV